MIDNNYKYINNIGFKIYFSGMTLFTVAFIEDGIFIMQWSYVKSSFG